MGSVPPPIGGDNHAHPHDHDGGGLTDIELRVRALESLMVEKGYVDPAALDAIVETYETKIGPRNGARVVARSWADPAFRRWLSEDATAAIGSLGYAGRQGEHMMAVENTAEVHNLVVCTLCSCYPWPVLGLPPVWYKSAPYRSRAVIDPRGVLADFGLMLPPTTKIRVWDSTAGDPLPRGSPATGRDRRLERGPAGRAGDARFDDRGGTGEGPGVAYRGAGRMNGAQDLGGMMGFGPVAGEPEGHLFHADWERRALALTIASGALGEWNIDMSRHARETLHPAEYLASSYYEVWIKGLEKLLLARGMVTPEEIAASRALHSPKATKPPLAAADVGPTLASGTPYDRPPQVPARFKAGERGAHAQHQSKRAYPPAALRARQARPNRTRARRLRISRLERPRSRPEPAMALSCVFPGVRALGP